MGPMETCPSNSRTRIITSEGMHFSSLCMYREGLLVWIVLSLRAREQDAGTPDSRPYAPGGVETQMLAVGSARLPPAIPNRGAHCGGSGAPPLSLFSPQPAPPPPP